MQLPHQKAFSLVELMIAIAIGLVLLVGLIQVFQSSKRSYTIQDSLARMQENGRYAMDLLRSDLRLSGYWGGNADISAIKGSSGIITPDGNCGSSGDPRWGRMLERSVFGINNDITNYNCIETFNEPSPEVGQYLANGDVITIRYADPLQITTFSPSDNNRYFIRTSLFDGKVFTGKDANSNNIDDNPVSTHRLVSHAYYVGHQNTECPGNTNLQIPTLFRKALSNDGTPIQEEMVRGIESLQIQYGVDNNNDGTTNQYRNADDIANWTNITSIRIWLLVRDECPSTGYTNDNLYIMGDVTLDRRNQNDRFRRHLYTTTINLRNS